MRIIIYTYINVLNIFIHIYIYAYICAPFFYKHHVCTSTQIDIHTHTQTHTQSRTYKAQNTFDAFSTKTPKKPPSPLPTPWLNCSAHYPPRKKKKTQQQTPLRCHCSILKYSYVETCISAKTKSGGTDQQGPLRCHCSKLKYLVHP